MPGIRGLEGRLIYLDAALQRNAAERPPSLTAGLQEHSGNTQGLQVQCGTTCDPQCPSVGVRTTALLGQLKAEDGRKEGRRMTGESFKRHAAV